MFKRSRLFSTAIKMALAAAFGSGVLTLAPGSGALAQDKKTLTFLSWNLPTYEENFRKWFAEFEEAHPGTKIEWLDKTGADWATFYQTQVVAGSQPDIVDVQGLLWVEYQDADQLLDLTPFLEREPDVKARFDEQGLSLLAREGRQYMLPFYFTKTLLLYNKKMFAEAGIAGPPQTVDELLAYAAKMSGNGKTGFITLNFDWAFWALFAAENVQFYNDDMSAAAFNTPQAVALVKKLADATAAGQIDKVSWTGRWVEPNSAFATGNVGMHQASTSAVFWIAGRAEWMNPETVGIAPLPGGYGVPSIHGFGIAKNTKDPEAAWDFIKLATSDKWQTVFADNFTILTLNKNVDQTLIGRISGSDPVKAAALNISVDNMDKMVGSWPSPLDARIKEVFWPPLQAALLGEKDPAAALSEAEEAVNRVLRRGR